MSHPITYFNDEEKTIVMELARLALADADTYDRVADELDLADDVLKDLQERIEKVTNGVDIYKEEDDA